MNSHLSESSQEQKNNKSDDEINVNCLSYIQTKHRRIDHRRNKSEPLIRSNLDEEEEQINLQSSSTSTTSNESALSHSSSQYQTNSSIKSPLNQHKPKSSSTTKKKKSWLYVSYPSLTRFNESIKYFFSSSTYA